VLDFGRIAANVRAARASRDEASAHYEHTVLAALEDANSALSRYGHQREHVVRLEQVDASAERASTLMRQRYTAGVATAIDLLDTERTQFSAQQDVIAGRAQLIGNFIQLQKSLGLGWQVQSQAPSPLASHPQSQPG
jgi:outer membrane protein TolC